MKHLPAAAAWVPLTLGLLLPMMAVDGFAQDADTTPPPPPVDPARALLSAARDGRLDAIEALLDQGVDVLAANRAGRTALMSAAYFGNLRTTGLLLSEGSDVNAADAAGRTALMDAAANGHQAVVSLLLTRSPDVNLVDGSGKSAHALAQGAGHGAIVGLLEAAGATAGGDAAQAPQEEEKKDG